METKEIPFTQYLLPDGRQRAMTANRPIDIANKAEEIIKSGYCFESEMLTTGEISLTISDGEDDVAIEVCKNGPIVNEKIDKMIEEFYETLKK